MNLRKRKRKTAQALDAAAGVTKIWSEWQIGKRASKGVAKVKKSGLKHKLTSKPVRFAGVAAVLGGAGAAVAKKLKGGGPEPIYTPPPPGEPVAPPDVPPPLTIAPEPTTPTDATSPQGTREPAAGEAALKPGGNGSEPAGDTPPGDDLVVEPETLQSGDPATDDEASADDPPQAVPPTDEPPVEPSTLEAAEPPLKDERGGDPA